MSPPGRSKGECQSAQYEGTAVSAAGPLHVLSLREMFRGPAQCCVVELEDVLAEMTGATVLAPRSVDELSVVLAGLPPRQGDLFVAAISLAQFSGSVKNIAGWRRPFRNVFVYVFDAWLNASTQPAPGWRGRISRYARAIHGVDQIFVPAASAVMPFQEACGVPVAYLPMAADVKRFGSMQAHRPISVNAYGRQHPGHVAALSVAFNEGSSERVLHHTDHFQVGDVTNHRQHRAFFWKLLSLSRLALAYDPMRVDPGGRQFPLAFLAQRWFESLAAGCVVLGFRPRCAETDLLLDWQDATIEVPEDSRQFLAFVEALLKDTLRLEAARTRNYLNMLRAHDWSHRVTDMLATMERPVGELARQRPTGLAHTFERLRNQTGVLSS